MSEKVAKKQLVPVLRKSTRTRPRDNQELHLQQQERHDVLNEAISRLRLEAGGGVGDGDGGADADDSWRKDGKEIRIKLLKEDNMNGGSDFHIKVYVSN